MKKQTKNKNKPFLNIFGLTIAALILSAMPISMLVKAGANLADEVPLLTRTAILRSPSGAVNPHGEATFELYQSGNRELEVEIEDVNLADNTILSIFIDGNSVGQATIVSRKAKLKLRSESGQNVPTVNDGSTVVARNGGTTIVSGTFGGGSTSTPTISPTVSPTNSPTASPTASPITSPTRTPTVTPTGTPTITPTVTPSPNAGELHAVLTGATINGVLPRGLGEFKAKNAGDRELEVYINQINLPAGTQLIVLVDNISVGQFVLDNNQRGKFEIESEHGQIVPNITAGSTLVIKNGTNTILSGTFAGNSNPTATPSPNGTPNATPTPNGQGRFFEAHLSGGAFAPAVATNGRGEVKVILDSTETQARVTGEIEHLSSAPTSAKITVTIGATTTLIFDLGVLVNGQEHFQTRTFAVSAQQVQQLRTGLWFVVVGTTTHPNGEIGGFLRSDSHSGDFDGDGRNDFAVFRPENGTWYVQKSSDSSLTVVQFGLSDDKPITADMDGDGRGDIAVFRPSNGNWYWLRSSDGRFDSAHFGQNGDIPIAGDFDGDGKSDLSVFRPSNGCWYFVRSSDNAFDFKQFGLSDDIPVAGNYDDDGKTDVAVFRPSNGIWYILRSADGAFDFRQFGLSGDIPANAR